MNERNAKRAVLLLFVLAVLIGGWTLFQRFAEDPNDGGTADTRGLIALVERTATGDQVVLMSPTGEKTTLPDGKAGAQDLGFAWRPDGHRLMVVSNRKSDSYGVLRYWPGNGALDQRLPGTRNAQAIFYDKEPEANNRGLVLIGGLVYELNQRTMALRQVLPPMTGAGPTMTEEDGAAGMGGPMSGMYSSLGESFQVAMYGPGRNSAFAVMTREQGQLLVWVSFLPGPNGETMPPVPLVAGRAIDIDVDAQGRCVVAIQEFQWVDERDPSIPEEFRTDKGLTTPFRNGMALFSVQDGRIGQPTFLFQSPDDQLALRHPRFSPDGSALTVISGEVKDRAFTSLSALVLPTTLGGQPRPIFGPGAGPVAWSPDGLRLAFVGPDPDGKRRLWTARPDGTELKPLGEPGNFRDPAFSPQL